MPWRAAHCHVRPRRASHRLRACNAAGGSWKVAIQEPERSEIIKGGHRLAHRDSACSQRPRSPGWETLVSSQLLLLDKSI
ncbi:TM2 domain-containing protein 1 [Platysternon megacephalum]|uniref:TM2 domain-containing protein 1 n=1 Tax=Platysternon megacephalum TaxID=55544 RepID=A0A4D9EJN3_9SAUR|nr:TM2 domain-containing protein 1 [Platysternon megacephalum]